MTTTQETSGNAPTNVPACCTCSGGKLAYRLMLVGVLVLAVTGVATFALGRAPMTGWVLMAHVGAAPLFAVGLAWVALTWADRSRFGAGGQPQGGLAKALVWFILASGLVVILSGVVPMTPLFGTEGQHTLYLTHRYSAIALTAAVVLHLVTLRGRRGAQSASGR
jgi:cytochrome b subunit of formate dehydrogenase